MPWCVLSIYNGRSSEKKKKLRNNFILRQKSNLWKLWINAKLSNYFLSYISKWLTLLEQMSTKQDLVLTGNIISVMVKNHQLCLSIAIFGYRNRPSWFSVCHQTCLQTQSSQSSEYIVWHRLCPLCHMFPRKRLQQHISR